MDKQHTELTYQLYKKYLLILGGSLLLFLGALLPINQLFLNEDRQFPHNYSDQQSSLTRIIAQSQSISDNINSVLQHQLSLNSINTQALYCNSNLSYQGCVSLMAQNSQSASILKVEGVSTSFRCTSGSCQQVGDLSNYFWLYKLRFPFIDYFHITYTNNLTTSTLLTPSLSLQTVSSSLITYPTIWSTTLLNNNLVLSKQYTNQYGIAIAVVLNSNILLSNYGIDLSQFDFNKPNNPFTSKQMHLQLELVTFNVVLISILVVGCIIVAYRVKILIAEWSQVNFQELQALDSLYRYQLHCIFTGKQPHNSPILNRSAMSDFYQDLSELIDKTYTSLSVRQSQPEKEEPFKFVPLIEKIRDKFGPEMKKQQQQRNRCLGDLKYQIKGAVSEITENVGRRMKETYHRAQELHLTRAFFYYGYIALLQSISAYEQRLRESSTALPEAISSLFRYINHTINSQNIMFPFKFAGIFSKVIEQELIIKLQFHMQQKYLSTLKELDFGMSHCRKLGLQKEIKYLQESIQNKKFIFMTYLK